MSTDRIEKQVLLQRPHTGATGRWQVVAVEPPRRLAYRWHPFAIDRGVDYESEPTTLVEFSLSEAPDGVLLTIIESGFDAIPVARRSSVFDADNGGWAKQVDLVRKYLALEQWV